MPLESDLKENSQVYPLNSSKEVDGPREKQISAERSMPTHLEKSKTIKFEKTIGFN